MPRVPPPPPPRRPRLVRIDTEGRDRLIAWLAGAWPSLSRREAQEALGRALGTSRVCVLRWLLGRYRPTPGLRATLEGVTRGAVPAASWARVRETGRHA